MLSLLELVVVLNLTANATAPAVVEDVYVHREASGEYLFHVAADADAIVTATTKRSIFEKLTGSKSVAVQKVDDNEYVLRHEVRIDFREEITALAQHYIDEGSGRLGVGDFNDLYNRWELESDTMAEVLYRFDSASVVLQIEAGTDSTAYVNIHTQRDGSVQLVMEYWRITNNRTINITSILKHPDYPIGELYSYWQSMVDQYSDIPMQVFSGASLLE